VIRPNPPFPFLEPLWGLRSPAKAMGEILKRQLFGIFQSNSIHFNMILVIKLEFKHLQEAISFGKKVALVEMGQNGNGKGIRNRLAKEAIIQAALMRITIGQSKKVDINNIANCSEEARSNGWTVEGEEGQKVSFWLNWSTVREGILAREKGENERIEAIFEQGKVN
jgi:hypothetical protein